MPKMSLSHCYKQKYSYISKPPKGKGVRQGPEVSPFTCDSNQKVSKGDKVNIKKSKRGIKIR